MKCLFCKKDSTKSKSIEHIIPETLGNTKLVLPAGFVCDQCNNYFSRKIEQPFFDMTEIKLLRFYEKIPNKKGKIPAIDALLNDKKISIERIQPKGDFPACIELLSIEGNIGEGIMLTPSYNDGKLLSLSRTTSRFIAKIAFEALALKIIDDPEWIEYLLSNKELDDMRNYVRFNAGEVWPSRVRRIYDINSEHFFSNGSTYQIIHESDFLMIKEKSHIDDKGNEILYGHLYFVIALWGLEFVINLADRTDEGLKKYDDWLDEHNQISFLHYGKNDNSTLIRGEKHE